MSDTQDEPFDKEAEKEKLRQQLAEEEADREATQHMSDLLLKGATMTNRHCDECGDPLFRHEGREFCPTCGRQRAAGGGGDAGADATTEPAEPAGDPAGEASPTSDAQAGTAGESATSPPQSRSADQPRSSPPQYAGEADLPEAREALARKVTALAREAEATTDVGRSRELLAAVREGAEALRALERSGR